MSMLSQVSKSRHGHPATFCASWNRLLIEVAHGRNDGLAVLDEGGSLRRTLLSESFPRLNIRRSLRRVLPSPYSRGNEVW